MSDPQTEPLRDSSALKERIAQLQARVTELERDNERRIREADRMRSVADSVFDVTAEALALIQADTQVLRINRSFARMFGIAGAEMSRRPLSDFSEAIPRIFADPVYVRTFMLSSLQDRTQKLSHEFKQLWPEPRELTLLSLPVLGMGRSFWGRLYVFRDITRERQVDRLKSEFVSMVSHELRTPLTSIRGSLGLILGGVTGELSAQTRELLEIANKNSERLVRLVNDILDIEKIEEGRIDFNLEPQPLLPLIQHAIEANRFYGEQFGVRFKLSPDSIDVLVRVDGDRVLQVMTNLLSNAAKFSLPESTVNVSITRRDPWVRVSVVDQGIGIPAPFRARIFERFAQVDASDERHKSGSGLGLAISKAIVEKLGGQIGFEPLQPQGTEFHFDLPIWGDVRFAAEASQALRRRILICDDNYDAALLLKLMLEQAGFDTDIAQDTTQVRQMLAKQSYDGMTLDLMLAGEDGLELLRELRTQAETRALPIVVISAIAEEGRRSLNDESYAVTDWLRKPVDSVRLVSAVKRALKKARGEKPFILHIESDEDVLTVVQAMLGDQAHCVRAHNLAEAQLSLRAQLYDLIILEMALPDGSGLSLLPLLKQHSPYTPIMIFSAHEFTGFRSAQIASVLVKARTSNQELLEQIRTLIA